ncbi:MAG TPA: FG-GAP-like repeat-containing protein [Terracidiphilus sp.]|nr:FG-GAP-like repeat-containing protein [Terracidiphilus sp.]
MSRLGFRWGTVFATIAMVLGGCSSSPPISVSLASSKQAVDQGIPVTITATITNDSSSEGAMWSLSGPGSLSSSSGVAVTYSSPSSTLTSPQQVTVTATSIKDPTKSAALDITINPPLALSIAQTLANGTVGKPYSEPVVVTGGTAPFQWSVYNGPIETGWQVGGWVPDGLKLDPTTGTISGTPTAAGTWYFEATVTDDDGAGAIDGFLSIQINPGASTAANPVPFLTQPLLPSAVAPGAGFTLSVSGTNFRSGATVDFNGVPLPTTFADSEHLSALVPAKSVAAAETASVTVVNPAPGGGASNVVYLQVAAPQTSVTFANAPNSPLPISEPYGLAAADFNQDGNADLAVADGVAGLFVLLGKGDGTFVSGPSSLERIPSPPYNDFGSPYISAMTVGDFNHSGYTGLAVSEFQNGAAVILLGNGNGGFTPSSAAFAQTKGQPTSALAAADFNADGNLDLAMINSISGYSLLALGYGSGAFNSAGALYTQGFPEGVAVGDFNGDGKLDAVIAGGGSTKYPYSGIAVSLGNGNGSFTSASGSPASVGEDLSAIGAGDFNADGKLDLALTDAGTNAVLILLGNGDGTFQPLLTIPVGSAPLAIVTGDFNNDGKLDLAVANDGDNTVTLLLGNGDGTFTQASDSPYAVGKGPAAIVAADFNGDGKLDLAVANVTDGTVSVLLQQ